MEWARAGSAIVYFFIGVFIAIIALPLIDNLIMKMPMGSSGATLETSDYGFVCKLGEYLIILMIVFIGPAVTAIGLDKGQ